SAIFNFQSLLTVILLLICTCAYIRALAPSLLDKNKSGILGIFWKCARIGELAQQTRRMRNEKKHQDMDCTIHKAQQNLDREKGETDLHHSNG
ncbi:unnamed protein product, partial [Coregonus sp. 'balchen']